jgi:hypothetical protein
MSVIKRLFGEHVTSRLVRTQNRELSFRCIAYNMHRLTNLFLLLMISTEPWDRYSLSIGVHYSIITSLSAITGMVLFIRKYPAGKALP